MIDFESEHILTFPQAAKVVEGQEVAEGTVRRWESQGINGIRLESFMRGGVRLTSMESLARFFERLSAKREADRAVPGKQENKVVSPRQRQVDLELKRRGC